MLVALFRYFDRNETAYWFLAVSSMALILAWIAYTFTRRGGRISPRSDTVMAGILLFVAVFAWRWPPLFGIAELNPDESQLIAGAITLKTDPVFWRSVDGTTSGPLNFYALLPVNMLGVPLDYFTARLSGLLMIWGTLWALYALLRHEYSPGVALLGLAPGWAMMSTMTDWDFIHYSSEHLSVLLLSLSLWLLWRSYRRRPHGGGFPRVAWIVAGLLMGMLPWAKLQSALFAASLALLGTCLALSRSDLRWAVRLREVAILAGAALATSVFFLVSILGYGLWDHFYTCYIENNLIYASSNITVVGVLKGLHALSVMSGSVYVLLLAPLSAVMLAATLGALRRRPPPALFWMALGLVAVSTQTVIAPRQAFQHYLLYAIPAITLFGAVAFAETWSLLESRPKRAILCIAFVLLGPCAFVANRARIPQITTLGELERAWIQPFSEQAMFVRSLKQPGDRIAVWGWDCQIYVETRLPQATREAHSTRQLWDSVQRDSYYRPRYMADLEGNMPAFFVDATGPGAFFFNDRDRWCHETFPDLRDFVARNYVLLEDFQRSRVYLRRDRYAQLSSTGMPLAQ